VLLSYFAYCGGDGEWTRGYTFSRDGETKEERFLQIRHTGCISNALKWRRMRWEKPVGAEKEYKV
jgi:hypothetical protein